jgi:DNA-binding LacI/PurR family transcriptional regulator/DNA-binding transcriptional regulator YhcF (GntR family)
MQVEIPCFTLEPAMPVHRQIERFLRRQIETAQLRPNDVLPSTAEIASTWRVGSKEVQTAMSRLQAEGLIERRRKVGTVVRDSAAVSVIGVLFGHDLNCEHAWYWRALFKAIEQALGEGGAAEFPFSRARGWMTRVYDDLTPLARQSAADIARTPIYRRLTADMTNYPFKGWLTIGTPPGETLGMVRSLDPEQEPPVVYLGEGMEPGSTDVTSDWSAFGRLAMEALHRHGRRRVVCLNTISNTPYLLEQSLPDSLCAAARRLGMPEPRMVALNSGAGLEQPERAGAEAMRQLVAEWRQNESWPDALLVTDDVVTRGVTRTLLVEGRSVAERLLVATDACAEAPFDYGLPVIRIELSATEIARQLLEVLWRRMNGQTVEEIPRKISWRVKEPVSLKPPHFQGRDKL